MSDALKERRRRQTEAARLTFLGQFTTSQERSAYFAKLGKRSAEARLTLSHDEAEALTRAYALLSAIARRHNLGGGDGS